MFFTHSDIFLILSNQIITGEAKANLIFLLTSEENVLILFNGLLVILP
jgi:hypothetical protein